MACFERGGYSLRDKKKWSIFDKQFFEDKNECYRLILWMIAK